MLLLVSAIGPINRRPNYFNTTYVTVSLQVATKEEAAEAHFNTTYVTVSPAGAYQTAFTIFNFNTTYVTVSLSLCRT